jgi:hypothetical protein
MSDDSLPKAGDRCPLAGCENSLSDGDHWYATGDGYHSYHTDKYGVARLWEHRDDLDVVPRTKPWGIDDG